jgi:transposase
MRHIKEVLRLKFAARLSHRQIARSLGLSVGVVAKYLTAASTAGLTFPLPAEMDDAQLLRALRAATSSPPAGGVVSSIVSPPRLREPDWATIHTELKRKGLTRLLLWEEYAAADTRASYSYPQFCALYREWRKHLKLSMRHVHIAGEKLFLDYCGPTISIVDQRTGEVREAQVFVAVMGASNYTFAEATWTQSLADWTASTSRSLAYFNGVPRLLIPDNLKAAVTKACRYEPTLTATYSDLAAHYGCAVLPARPYKPRDKAKVETGVQVVERWILARLRHHTFFSLLSLNIAIRELLSDLNTRPFKRLPGCRRSQFEALDAPALSPLPSQPYEYAEWKRARVNIDYHIEVDRHFYSVPHPLVRREVEVRLTPSTVEVFHSGRRVASHARSPRHGAHSTTPDHMPKAHRAHLEWSPSRFLRWAASIGKHTHLIVEHTFATKPHPEMGYRSCLGLLNLTKQYGTVRVEAACARAVALHAPHRSTVASILKRGLDSQPLDGVTADDEPHLAPRTHDNVRGADYYR